MVFGIGKKKDDESTASSLTPQIREYLLGERLVPPDVSVDDLVYRRLQISHMWARASYDVLLRGSNQVVVSLDERNDGSLKVYVSK